MGITDDFYKQIMAEFDRMGIKPGSIEEFNKVAGQVNQRHNESPIKDFEGLSPALMHQVLHFPFSDKCPVQISTFLRIHQLLGSPMLQFAVKLLSIMNTEEGIRLTASGNLPRKIVMEIYDMGYFRSPTFDLLAPKVLNEKDYLPLRLCHMLLKISCQVKVSKGKLVLTKTGLNALGDPLNCFLICYWLFARNSTRPTLMDTF